MDSVDSLVKLINLLAFLSCFIFVCSLLFIPTLPSHTQRQSLSYFKIGIALLPLGYLFGSLQILYPNNYLLKDLGVVLANMSLFSGYFLIAKAVECKVNRRKCFNMASYIGLLTLVIFISSIYLDDFKTRNTIIPVIQGLIIFIALILNTHSQALNHRGGVAMNIALGVLCINLLCIYPSVTYTTASGIKFSILFATLIITNCAAITIATFSLYFNEVLDKEKNEAALDTLTGAYTRKLLDKLKTASEQFSFSGSLIICDIDYFKEINDSYGHQAGDEALIQFSNVVMSCIRAEDKLIRYGGEEFLVLLDKMSLPDAQLVAERIRASIEAHKFSYRDKTFKITASLGVSNCTRSDSMEQSIRKTDELLYKAKHQGRNCVVS